MIKGFHRSLTLSNLEPLSFQKDHFFLSNFGTLSLFSLTQVGLRNLDSCGEKAIVLSCQEYALGVGDEPRPFRPDPQISVVKTGPLPVTWLLFLDPGRLMKSLIF